MTDQLLADFQRYVADVQASNGYLAWARDNHGGRGYSVDNPKPGSELARWVPFRDQILRGTRPTPPQLASAFGKSLVDAGVEYLDATAPVTPPPPPPPPPPSSGMDVGSNAYPGQAAKALELSKHVRVDRGNLSDWAGMTVCAITTDPASAFAQAPTRELGNEPYFNNWDGFGDPRTWATHMRDAAKAMKQNQPGGKVILPMNVVNNGDVYTLAAGVNHPQEALDAERAYHAAFHTEHRKLSASRGVAHELHRLTQEDHDALHEKALAVSDLAAYGASWQPLVTVVNSAAPDIWQYLDGVAVHPYCDGQPPAGTPSMKSLDTIRGHLQTVGGKAAGLPFYVTEFGYSSGPTQDGQQPVTEQQQADYLGQQLGILAARGDVAAAYVFVLYDQTGVWAYGVLRADGSRKPSWDAVHAYAG